MKTPEEIKKALKCHRDGRACHDCPYEQGRTFSVDGVTFGCSKDIVADALDYIERLEAKMEERTMSETPKCPGCGRKMALREDFHKFFFACLDCGWKSPYGQNEKEGLDLALKRAEPKNRVLTLEEVRNGEKDAFDFALHWLELKFEPHKCKGEETASAIFAVSMYFDDESDDVIYSPAYVTDYYLLKNQYGKKWRCWLRKPTEAERWETPWG